MTEIDGAARVAVKETEGALLRLFDASPQAGALLNSVLQVVAEEAARTPRFAKALVAAAQSAVAGGEAAGPPSPAPAPRKRAPARAKVVRQPGAFDPFVVYRESGPQELERRLVGLTIDQLRDIIAEQEIDTHKETSRKRSQKVLVDWTVERVRALAEKGSAFR
ncbi:hypothetical protein [Millisia brevis]|uniref:hypothetical protein n=1 Tax=Millisia brevis TaxID=264148 RepID=UPI0008301EDE|nr:hypothetical protein [Millisia brevis]